MEEPGAPDQGFGHRENGSQGHQPDVHGRAVEHEGHAHHGADDEPEKHGGLAASADDEPTALAAIDQRPSGQAPHAIGLHRWHGVWASTAVRSGEPDHGA